MKYFALSPEVAGEVGPGSDGDFSTFPPTIYKLHYVFQGWLGDDLLESFPCYIVTDRLKAEIEQADLSGYQFSAVEVTASDLFQELYPNRDLPSFVWLIPTGTVDVDDFGFSKAYQLVVSERAWEVINKYQVEHCDVQEYVPLQEL